MESMQFILQAISTVGFPIVACGAMFWKINQQDKQHKEEMDSVTKALENNTIALTKLEDSITNSNK